MELWLACSHTQWQFPLTKPLVVPSYSPYNILLLRQFVKEWGGWEECSWVLAPLPPSTSVTVASRWRHQQRVCHHFNCGCGADVWAGSSVLQTLLKVMEMSPSSLLLAKLDPREGDKFCPLNNFLTTLLWSLVRILFSFLESCQGGMFWYCQVLVFPTKRQTKICPLYITHQSYLKGSSLHPWTNFAELYVLNAKEAEMQHLSPWSWFSNGEHCLIE